MTSFAEFIELEIIGCEANKARDGFYGALPLGMMINDEGSFNNITMQQLVNGATLIHDVDRTFKAVEHIRDNDSMLEIHKAYTRTSRETVVNMGDVAGEMFTYVIIAAPNRPLQVSGTAAALNYAPYSLQLSFGTNAIIYPKNDAISRSLAVNLDKDEKYAHHRKSYKNRLSYNSAHPLCLTLKDSESQPGFFSRAWAWLKDVDYDKWFTVLKTAATLLAEPQESESFLQRPQEFWARYGECIPPEISQDNWAVDHIQDPRLQEVFKRYAEAVKDFKSATFGVPDYMYPEQKWSPPEEIVTDDPRTTYDNVIRAGSSIPLMGYVPTIGWTLQVITDAARQWFVKFCFLIDNMSKKHDSVDNSFLKIRK